MNIKHYLSKLNWPNIILIAIASPAILGFFWDFIGDPLIGKSSKHIDYGYTRYLPDEYYRKYSQDGRIELREDVFRVWRSEHEELIATCQPESFDISYARRIQSNGFKTYLMGLLPQTLYGNYVATVTCKSSIPSEANRWVVEFDDFNCVNVSYTEKINENEMEVSKSAC